MSSLTVTVVVPVEVMSSRVGLGRQFHDRRLGREPPADPCAMRSSSRLPMRVEIKSGTPIEIVVTYVEADMLSHHGCRGKESSTSTRTDCIEDAPDSTLSMTFPTIPLR